MRFGIRFTVFLLPLFLALSACATKRYEGPISGVASDAQRVMSSALGRATEHLDSSAYKVEVEVHADGGLGRTWGLETYLLRLIEETVTREGGFVSRDGERRLVIFARTTGTSAIFRRFSIPTGQGLSIPFWYSETSEGVADFLLLYQDKDRKTIKAQLNTQTADVRDVFLFYFMHVPDEMLNK